jgi:4a-hydroxytetrahydrobiopterin dehydratase
LGKIVIDNKERLHRELRFEDFSAAFGFMTQVAMIANVFRHHLNGSMFIISSLSILYRHETGDITEYDLNFAQR